jgi:hypothetical protein
MHYYDNILLNYPWKEKGFRQKMYRKPKHIFYILKLLSENHANYEIQWKNVVQRQDKNDNITQFMHFAC